MEMLAKFKVVVGEHGQTHESLQSLHKQDCYNFL